MSIIQSVRSRLPSRNWCIFFGTTGTLAGLAAYDKYHLRDVHRELNERASVLGNEPMQTWELPRKVKVYVAPTHWARYWFKEYIKPVFDAAALDYEVVEPRNAGHVRRSVRDLIWTGKDEFRARPPSYQHDPSPHAALGNPLDRSKYEAGEGLVAVGPNAWREILRGLNEGCMAERPPQAPPKPVDLDSEAKSTDEKPKEEQAEPLLDLSPGNIPSFALPGLGYITGKNQAGWSGFPKRIYGWFTERKTAKEIGEESLKVCFGRARDFKADDANLGAKDLYIDDDWSDELKGAVEEVHVPEEVAEKLYIYA